jgi:hypothetical protein
VQERPPGLALIDYVEGTQQALTQWILRVRELPYIYDQSKLGLSRSPYERHFAPHDLAQTEYGYGKTRYTIAMEHGLHFTVVPRGPLEDGIEATRQLLRLVLIDEQRCAVGLEALRGYEYTWNDEAQVYSKTPAHTWASHGADALRTGAIGLLPSLRPLKAGVPPGSFDWAKREIQRAKRGLPPRTYRVGGG